MKIVQSVSGKFHHFHLARQLFQRGMLEKIFSSYPRRKLQGEDIPANLLKTFAMVHMLSLGNMRYGFKQQAIVEQIAHWDRLTFDRFVARHLPECDVFIGLSGSALITGCKARRRGAMFVCDRGSSHIRFADTILRQEFQQWDQNFSGIDPRNIALEEQEYAAADLITVPSEFVLRSFITMGVPAEKIRKVPYGADLSRFSKVADPDPERFDVLFVGQVSFRKGIPYLLEAFERLRHPKKKLTIVGGVLPEMATFLQRKAFSGVEFVGQLPHIRLKEVMSRSHVLVLPSLEEGLAMVQGEAMACGCPVIASENTGAEDLFKNGQEGFIVPVRDPKSITEHLEMLAQNPAQRDKMSEQCLRRVTEIGGWNTYGLDYVTVLEAALSRKCS